MACLRFRDALGVCLPRVPWKEGFLGTSREEGASRHGHREAAPGGQNRVPRSPEVGRSWPRAQASGPTESEADEEEKSAGGAEVPVGALSPGEDSP